MKVAIIQPPQAGHVLRGTGVYARLLTQSLKQYTDIHVLSANFSQLPQDADIYHFPYFDPFFLTLPLIKRKPWVITIHDVIPLRFPDRFPAGFRGSIKWQVQKYLTRQANAIITDSQCSKRDIQEIMKIDPNVVHAIYLAPEDAYYQPRSKEEKIEVLDKYKLPERFMLYVGDVNWNKNIPNLLRAVGKLKVNLVMVCHGLTQLIEKNNPWQNSLLEADTILKDIKNVKVIASVTSEELSALYQSAQCLVMPSFYEGFGLPVVEAFASNCPVVTTRMGSLGEIAQDGAYYIDPGNIEGIIEGIQTVINNNGIRQDLTNKGKERVREFSWKKTALETKEVYSSIIS